MREITTHKIEGLNDGLTVEALGSPGPGGANCLYSIGFANRDGFLDSSTLKFQDGPIIEAGVNGISNESLLAVLIDRLEGFQHGEFPCDSNAVALTHLRAAMRWLHLRTRERMVRGVEGTNQK